MKVFSLVASVLLSVLILIIAFENIQAQLNFITVLFWELPTTFSPTFFILGISALGMVTGAFMCSLFRSIFSDSDEDEEDNF